MINPSMTNEYSCVLLPTAAPSAVRLPLQLTGKPLDSEATALPAPSAVHSWFASICQPGPGAKTRAVRTLSV